MFKVPNTVAIAARGAALSMAMLLGVSTVTPSKADAFTTLSFTGAHFASGSAIASGTFSYSYDIGSNVTAVQSVDINVSSGTGTPAYHFVYNVAGSTTNTNVPAVVINDAADQVYAIQVQSSTTSDVFYPEWTGLASAAQLITSSPLVAGFSSYDGSAMNDAGVTTTLASAVPEPASAALLVVGLGGMLMARRKARSSNAA